MFLNHHIITSKHKPQFFYTLQQQHMHAVHMYLVPCVLPIINKVIRAALHSQLRATLYQALDKQAE